MRSRLLIVVCMLAAPWACSGGPVSVERLDAGDAGGDAGPTPVPPDAGGVLAIADAGPLVFYVSDPLTAGQVALLFGARIDPDGGVLGWRVEDDPLAVPTLLPPSFDRADGAPLTVLAASPRSVKAVIPPGWAAGIFAVRLQNDAGWSGAFFFNRPSVYWFRGGAGPAGEVIFADGGLRLFGRNFGQSPAAFLVSDAGSIALSRTPAATDDDYNASFDLPGGVAPGNYGLAVSNGFGGSFGFSPLLAVEVSAPPAPWPTQVFDVRQFGAAGDGGIDDSAAFQAALSAAGANDGGVIQIPAGTFRLVEPLLIPPYTVLQGAGQTRTILESTGTASTAMLLGDHDVALQDLELTSATIHRLFTCPDDPGLDNDYGVNPWQISKTCVNVSFSRVQVEADTVWYPTADGGPRSVAGTLFAGRDFSIVDSRFQTVDGPALEVSNSDHFEVAGNTFLSGNGVTDFEDTAEAVLEGNEFTHAPGAIGNTLSFQRRAHHDYLARNYAHDGTGTYGEGISFDTNYYTYWYGIPAAIDGANVTLSASDGGVVDAGSFVGVACTVVAGTGLGQRREVVAGDGLQATVDRPFDLPLDETSVLALVSDKTETVLTHNRVSNDTVCVQLYTQGYGFVIDGNDCDQTGGSYAVGEDFETASGLRFSVDYFNTWIGNGFDGGYPPDASFSMDQGFSGAALGPLQSTTGLDSKTVPPLPGIQHVADVVRGNLCYGDVVMGALYGGSVSSQPSTPPVIQAPYLGQDTLFEDNVSVGAPVGLEIDPWYVSSMVRGNDIQGSPQPYVDHGTATWSDVDGG